MRYIVGNLAIDFSRHENSYVAIWDAGNCVAEKWEVFIAEIVRRTGVNRDELIMQAKDFFGEPKTPKFGGPGSLTIQ
ncbi:hypothetical protein [Cronobacter sakazakii]|uniref:hypothetical protein n=1 Tax=Cronobacter sakazakii TaxID=28141 RepID=UPI001AE84BAB|nr:hypothetical protein [Cronobacter sakazakii]